MNGLLQRLAERALGVAPVVRPFVPSRFALEEPGGAATGLELDRTMEVEARRPPAPQAPPRGAEPPVHRAAHPSDGDPRIRLDPGGRAQTGRAAETAARGSSSTEPPLVAARAVAPPAALTPSPPSPASEAGPAQRVERQARAAPARTGPIDPDALLASEAPLARDDRLADDAAGAPTRRAPPSDAAAPTTAAHAETPVAMRTAQPPAARPAQPPAARPGPAPTPRALLVPLDSPPDGPLLVELGRSPSHPASPSGGALAPAPAEIVALAPARATSLPGAAAPPVTPALARPALPPSHRVEHDPFTGSALPPAAAMAPVVVSRSEAAPPAIRVTIGRVEVRAVLPAAEPRRPVPPPAQPPISLDDYLRQRDRGHR